MIKTRRVSKYPPKKIARTDGSTIYTTRIEPYDRLIIIKQFDLKIFAPIMEYVVRELHTLMKINHPNLVKILEIWADEPLPVVVMEHGGDTLWDFARITSRHDKIEHFPRIFGQTFAGLNYMHTNNIIHRDLKSSNILIRMNDNVVPSDPIVKICDFGLSRIISDTMSPKTATPSYRAPEILNHDEYNEKIDIWSMGCVIYEYIENEVLFEGTDNKFIYQKVKEFLNGYLQLTHLAKPTRHAKTQQPLIDNIVMVLKKILAMKPSDRPSATDCLNMVNPSYSIEMKQFLLMKPPMHLLRKSLIVDLNIRYVIVANMLDMDKYYDVSRDTLSLAVDIYDKWLMTTDGSEDLILFSLAAVVLASYMSNILEASEFASVYDVDVINNTVKVIFRDIGYSLDYLDLWTSMKQVINNHGLPTTDDHMEFYWQNVCELLTNYDQIFAKTQDETKILLDKIIA